MENCSSLSCFLLQEFLRKTYTIEGKYPIIPSYSEDLFVWIQSIVRAERIPLNMSYLDWLKSVPFPSSVLDQVYLEQVGIPISNPRIRTEILWITLIQKTIDPQIQVSPETWEYFQTVSGKFLEK